jgi:ANTAR domain-containing protein
MRASRRLARDVAQGSPATSRDPLEWSPYARLRAQLATMPVIEQAKGIIMAQHGCDDEQAFQLLRRASQRSNQPVRELAADLVARAQRPSGDIEADPGRG